MRRTVPEAVRFLHWALAANVAAGLAVWVQFLISGSYGLLNWYFAHVGALFIVGMAAAGSALTWMVLSQFEREEPMHAVWTLIFLAALSRLCGSVFTELIARQGGTPSFRSAGLIANGPLAMMFLAAGLTRAIGIKRRFHLLGALRPADILLIAVIACVTVRQLVEIGFLLFGAHFRPAFAQAMMWLTDPLLAMLLVQAVLIRRSVLEMGHGLIAKCWGAMTVGIACTSSGDIALWITRQWAIPETLVPLSWYVWFFAPVFFAVAPAYQLAAIRQALDPTGAEERSSRGAPLLIFS